MNIERIGLLTPVYPTELGLGSDHLLIIEVRKDGHAEPRDRDYIGTVKSYEHSASDPPAPRIREGASCTDATVTLRIAARLTQLDHAGSSQLHIASWITAKPPKHTAETRLFHYSRPTELSLAAGPACQAQLFVLGSILESRETLTGQQVMRIDAGGENFCYTRTYGICGDVGHAIPE